MGRARLGCRMKFRKKPVVIDAWQWDGRSEEGAPGWFVEGRKNVFSGKPGSILRNYNQLQILTLEGMMYASTGDWIIRGVKGEIYPCKPAIFAQTYEPVEEAHGATEGT